MNLQEGAIKNHMWDEHHQLLTREIGTNNTKILKTMEDTNRLEIGEAILIREVEPGLNDQQTGSKRILRLFSGPRDGAPRGNVAQIVNRGGNNVHEMRPVMRDAPQVQEDQPLQAPAIAHRTRARVAAAARDRDV